MAGREEPSGTLTLAGLVRQAAATLSAAGFPPDASLTDVEVLVRYLLQWDRAEWLVRLREPAPPALREALAPLLDRRLAHEPVAYLTGTREFYGRAFRVGPGVLVPRPETETVVHEALHAIAERLTATGASPIQVADVGTGSGCLAITVALECDDAEVTASDISPAALAIARDNAARLGAAARVQFRLAPLLGGSEHAYDVVMSNPPYIAEVDRRELMPDVRDHEPALALFGGVDGLDVIRELLPASERALRRGGWLVMEIGSTQVGEVTSLVQERTGLAPVKVVQDLAGRPRVMVARKADG